MTYTKFFLMLYLIGDSSNDSVRVDTEWVEPDELLWLPLAEWNFHGKFGLTRESMAGQLQEFGQRGAGVLYGLDHTGVSAIYRGGLVSLDVDNELGRRAMTEAIRRQNEHH